MLDSKHLIKSKINFNDTLRGNISVDSNTLDDFIIIKSDGFPTYNFASALDDAQMGITNVIRGKTIYQIHQNKF